MINAFYDQIAKMGVHVVEKRNRKNEKFEGLELESLEIEIPPTVIRDISRLGEKGVISQQEIINPQIYPRFLSTNSP